MSRGAEIALVLGLAVSIALLLLAILAMGLRNAVNEIMEVINRGIE